MICVIQRVTWGKVLIENKLYSQIGKGYVILAGFCKEDKREDVIKMANKIVNLRVMSDKNGKMNLTIIETKGEILLVSQFTLCADTNQRRPSFIRAKKPGEAKKLYNFLINKLRENNISVKTGRFGSYMNIQLSNDGPVTIILDTKK